MRRGWLAAGLFTMTLTTAARDAHAQGGTTVTAASDGEKARAQDLYKSGALSFEFRRYDDALAKFKASYGVVRSPNTHLMVARSLVELGQKVEAFNELVETESEARAAGDRYADAGNKAAELRASLVKDVAVITVQVTGAESAGAAATVLVAGEDWPRQRWNVPRAMQPASLEIIGRYHGAERDKKSVQVEVGTPKTVTVDVGAPVAPPVDPLPSPKKAPVDESEPGGSALLPLAATSKPPSASQRRDPTAARQSPATPRPQHRGESPPPAPPARASSPASPTARATPSPSTPPTPSATRRSHRRRTR